jgi:hypothetical protein
MAYRLFLSEGNGFSVRERTFFPKFRSRERMVTVEIQPENVIETIPYGKTQEIHGIEITFEHNKGRFVIIATPDNAPITLIKGKT